MRAPESELVKTRAGLVLGTLLYASPEQSLADLIDRRSDLYSAGMVLYALLTGEQPIPCPFPWEAAFAAGKCFLEYRRWRGPELP